MGKIRAVFANDFLGGGTDVGMGEAPRLGGEAAVFVADIACAGCGLGLHAEQGEGQGVWFDSLQLFWL